MTEPAETPTSGRSRARRNVIGRSKHRDEYEAMMKAGWSSLALERYAAFRYGEDIPASTFRSYRTRKKIEAPVQPIVVEASETVDVLGERARLIALQKARIALDWTHEQSMSKLFGSTKGEIALLSSLLSEHKVDLQDLGLLPKAGQSVTVHTEGVPEQGPEAAPRALTLGALLGAAQLDPVQEQDLARVVHLAAKQQAG